MLRRSRRGFTLAEIVVATTVLAALGLAFTRMLLTQGRFSDQQNAYRNARSVARQSMNVLLSELRMVPEGDGFVDAAAADGKSISVLVPYRFGITCGMTGSLGAAGSRNIVMMLPEDSLQYAQAQYYGWAWRDPSTGLYSKILLSDPNGQAPTSTSNTACTTAGIAALTVSGRTGDKWSLRPAGTATVAAPVMIFQRVTYAFKASTAFPGKVGLWRYPNGGTDEELVAPFDTSARFKYWAAGASASTSAPPASLNNLRGVDVVLAGLSTYTPSGKTSPVTSTLVTSIFFKNVQTY